MSRLFATALALALACVNAADAQNYPSRTITLVVPFPAGGGTSLLGLGHILAEQLKTELGQTVIVENVGGAGGSIGVARVARAAPDGYTLVFGGRAMSAPARSIRSTMICSRASNRWRELPTRRCGSSPAPRQRSQGADHLAQG